jgi:hypothetical protein
MFRIHLPAREYLYTTLNSGKFPLWAEYKLTGYPMYADLENMYLNPLNIILTYIFGPYTSLKLLLFIIYLLGSFGMYKLLKKHGGSLLGYFCSNSIYFFSLYSFFHTQHLGIILTIYILPLGLFLFSSFNKSLKSIILLSLIDIFTLSFGSFQMFLISFIARAFYFLCFIYSRTTIISDLKKFIIYIVFASILSLPILLPSIELFSYSNGISRVNQYEGSLYPINLLTGFIPFIYGKDGYFDGYIFCKGCVIQEVYFYFGISSLIIFLVFIMFKNDNKVYNFCLFLVGTAIFLSVFGVIPNLSNYLGFPFNLFRYWPRALILLIFGVSFGVSHFLSTKKIGELKFINLVPYFIFVSSLILIQIYITNFDFLKNFWFYILNYSFENQSSHMKIWLLITVISIIFIIPLLLTKQKNFIFRFLIALVVFIDLSIFISISVKQNGFVDVNTLPSKDVCISNLVNLESNSRLLDLSGCLNSENTHVTNLWSILGRTQYTNAGYREILSSIGLTQDREISAKSGLKLMKTIDYEAVKKIGVSKIYTPDGKIIDLNNSIIPSPVVVNVKPLPGEINAKINQSVSTTETINTYIKYYPGWRVFVDKKPVKLNITENGFISFVINPGDTEILMQFWPEAFLYGLVLTTILFPLTVFIVVKFQKKLIFAN